MNSYFKEIDRLRAKFNNGFPLGLKEASWIIWAELYVNTYRIDEFMRWVKSKRVNGRKSWLKWKTLFRKWELSLEMNKYRYNV